MHPPKTKPTVNMEKISLYSSQKFSETVKSSLSFDFEGKIPPKTQTTNQKPIHSKSQIGCEGNWCVERQLSSLPFFDLKIRDKSTTFNGGSLGSCIDEERCELRYVMRIAQLSESSKF